MKRISRCASCNKNDLLFRGSESEPVRYRLLGAGARYVIVTASFAFAPGVALGVTTTHLIFRFVIPAETRTG